MGLNNIILSWSSSLYALLGYKNNNENYKIYKLIKNNSWFGVSYIRKAFSITHIWALIRLITGIYPPIDY